EIDGAQLDAFDDLAFTAQGAVGKLFYLELARQIGFQRLDEGVGPRAVMRTGGQRIGELEVLGRGGSCDERSGNTRGGQQFREPVGAHLSSFLDTWGWRCTEPAARGPVIMSKRPARRYRGFRATARPPPRFLPPTPRRTRYPQRASLAGAHSRPASWGSSFPGPVPPRPGNTAYPTPGIPA